MKFVAEIVKNSSGQIYLRSPNGDSFDLSQYVGEKLYILLPREVNSLVYRRDRQARIDALMLEETIHRGQ